MRRTAVVVLVTAASVIQPAISAQSKPSLEQLLDRMGAYLADYETQLSSVVAEERFEQSIYGGRGRSSALLESEVAFIAFPAERSGSGFATSSA